MKMAPFSSEFRLHCTNLPFSFLNSIPIQSMVDQENNVRSICVSKKRPSPATDHLQFPASKKRVPFGDLTNSPDIALNQSSDPSKENTIRKTKNKKDQSSLNRQKFACESSIYKHLHALEMDVNRRPLPRYMEKVQKDVSKSMREILVDWLVEVAEEYKLVSDTIYLAVSYVDRFLSINDINRNKLQLLGVSAMLIASKYEEIAPPNVEDFCYITDNSYTVDEVKDMEREIQSLPNFETGNPTAKSFLRIFTKAAQENFKGSKLQLEFMASYLLELSLLDIGCMKFLPSVAAASALFLSSFTLESKTRPWNLALQCHTGYKPSDLKDCVLAMRGLQWNIKRSSLQAVPVKYSKTKFICVSSFTSPDIPASYFEPVHE